MRQLIKLIQKVYKMVDPQEGKRVMHNVLSLSGLQAITYLLPMVILPYLFQTLGPERFGLIAFAQAFVQYFIILTDYGFSVSATKEISLCHDDEQKISKVYSAVMTVKLVLCLVSLVVLLLCVYFVPRFQEEAMVYVLSFGVVVGTTLFPVWFFQGTENMKYIAKINIFGEFIYAFSIFFLIKGPLDYVLVPVINSTVFLVVGLLGQYIAIRHFGIHLRFPTLKDLKRQLDAGWNIFISVVAINTYTITRIFAVGLMTNNTLTGFYSIAERIANAVQTFPLSSFTQAIFPRLSKIYHKNTHKAFEIMQHVQLITILISLIFLPAIFIFSPAIIKVVCGGYYPEAVLALRFLLVSVFFVSANAFRVQFLLVSGHTDIYSRIHVSMAMVGLPLIILLIYKFSYAGAAMATMAIEAGVFFSTYLALKRLKI
jgi:polysaccharide transporter, PST family